MRAGWAADWANASTVIPELFGQDGGFNYHSNEGDAAFGAFQTKVDEATHEDVDIAVKTLAEGVSKDKDRVIIVRSHSNEFFFSSSYKA